MYVPQANEASEASLLVALPERSRPAKMIPTKQLSRRDLSRAGGWGGGGRGGAAGPPPPPPTPTTTGTTAQPGPRLEGSWPQLGQAARRPRCR
jgi:hypothetical protein